MEQGTIAERLVQRRRSSHADHNTNPEQNDDVNINTGAISDDNDKPNDGDEEKNDMFEKIMNIMRDVSRIKPRNSRQVPRRSRASVTPPTTPEYSPTKGAKPQIRQYWKRHPDTNEDGVIAWMLDNSDTDSSDIKKTTVATYLREFNAPTKRHEKHIRAKYSGSPRKSYVIRTKMEDIIADAIKNLNTRSLIEVLDGGCENASTNTESNDMPSAIGTAAISVASIKSYLQKIKTLKTDEAMLHKNILLMACSPTKSNTDLNWHASSNAISKMLNIRANTVLDNYNARDAYDRDPTATTFDVVQERTGHGLSLNIVRILRDLWFDNTVPVNSQHKVTIVDEFDNKCKVPMRLQTMTNREIYNILHAPSPYNEFFINNDLKIPSISCVISYKPPEIKIDKKTVRYIYCRYCHNVKNMIRALTRVLALTCKCGTDECVNFVCRCGFGDDGEIDADAECDCKCDCDSCSNCDILNENIKKYGIWARLKICDTIGSDDSISIYIANSYLREEPVCNYGCALKYLKTKKNKHVRDVPVNPGQHGIIFNENCANWHRKIANKRSRHIDKNTTECINSCGWAYYANLLKSDVSSICPTASIPDKKHLIRCKQVGLHLKNVCYSFVCCVVWNSSYRLFGMILIVNIIEILST